MGHPTCNKPDRDEPKMVCGYPLPCPFHTVVIDENMLTIPHHSAAARSPVLKRRLKEIQRALRKGPR